MKRFVGYPWRLFWKILVYQLLAFNGLFSVVTLINWDPNHPSLIDDYTATFSVFFILSIFISSYIAHRFVRPLRTVTLKALRISNKATYGSLLEQEEDLLDTKLDDISELDMALNHIHRKMKMRKARYLQTQEESQAFMSAVAEGLVSISPDEKILYFNSQFAAQFLKQDQIQAETLRLKDVIRSSDVLEGFGHAITMGQSSRFTVQLSTLIDNQLRYFAVSVNPVRNAATKEIYAFVGIFHDITEYKKAEKVLIDFVGNASHELRTPLTSIKGYIDTLKEDFKTGQIQHAGKFLDIVSRNIDRLIDLITDLLSLSTLESDSKLKLVLINPLEISEHILSEMAVMAADKNISIRIVGEAPSFMADQYKVEQVLRNLVSNALKFIPSGKTVSIRWEGSGEQQVVLKVIDDGPGIPEEHLDRLFERFYRIDKGRSRDTGGTGLGLAIVKHIMQSHGGSVTVKSSPGTGCEFVCTFPI